MSSITSVRIKTISPLEQFRKASSASPLLEFRTSATKKAVKEKKKDKDCDDDKKKKKPPKCPPEEPPMADPTLEERERRRNAILLLDILPQFLDPGDEKIGKALTESDQLKVLIERDKPPGPTKTEQRDLALAELVKLGVDLDR